MTDPGSTQPPPATEPSDKPASRLATALSVVAGLALIVGLWPTGSGDSALGPSIVKALVLPWIVLALDILLVMAIPRAIRRYPVLPPTAAPAFNTIIGVIIAFASSLAAVVFLFFACVKAIN